MKNAMYWRQAQDLRTRDVVPELFDLAELSIPPTIFSESRDGDPGDTACDDTCSDQGGGSSTYGTPCLEADALGEFFASG